MAPPITLNGYLTLAGINASTLKNLVSYLIIHPVTETGYMVAIARTGQVTYGLIYHDSDMDLSYVVKLADEFLPVNFNNKEILPSNILSLVKVLNTHPKKEVQYDPHNIAIGDQVTEYSFIVVDTDDIDIKLVDILVVAIDKYLGTRIESHTGVDGLVRLNLPWYSVYNIYLYDNNNTAAAGMKWVDTFMGGGAADITLLGGDLTEGIYLEMTEVHEAN